MLIQMRTQILTPLLQVSALAGLLTIAGCRQSGVTVDVVNDTSQVIETITLTGETGVASAAIPSETVGPLAPGKQQRVVLSEITGEGSYSIQVVFEDGRELKGAGGAYVEGGYRMSETVKETEIISETDLY